MLSIFATVNGSTRNCARSTGIFNHCAASMPVPADTSAANVISFRMLVRRASFVLLCAMLPVFSQYLLIQLADDIHRMAAVHFVYILQVEHERHSCPHAEQSVARGTLGHFRSILAKLFHLFGIQFLYDNHNQRQGDGESKNFNLRPREFHLYYL